MERALNLASISEALGGTHALLPTPEELRDLLAQTELQVFLGRQELSDDLLATGWYLHAVGSANPDLASYGLDQQRRANQVAGHIFDLALQSMQLDRIETLQLTFAAQVSYLRGGLDPNAAALYRRLDRTDFSFTTDPVQPVLEMAVILLALDRARFFAEARRLRDELEAFAAAYGIDSVDSTRYVAADLVLRAMNELMIYLTYGDAGAPVQDESRLERARGDLTRALNAEAPADFEARWIAAHLLDVVDDFGASSVWSVVPPGMPSGPARAMALGDPPVLSLWPPQVDLLTSAEYPNPLLTSTRRLVLSFPTSAGKTLLAQLFVAAHLVQSAGRVCYVAPTHSLCREVRRAFDARLRFMAERARDEGALGTNPSSPATNARVSVMTPERLAQLLRNDAKRVLDDYSLFVIDEAHLVGESERGWTLESALSFLHHATRDTTHRIIVISAAIGNRVEVQQWLNPVEPLEPFHRDWRGPRRGHAIFTTTADWNSAITEPPRRSGGLVRRRIPLFGSIAIRSGPGAVEHLKTREPVGELVQVRRGSRWERHAAESSRQYQMCVPVVIHLAQHGPVLVVESTRDAAQRFARALADKLPATDETAALVRLATLRLTAAHPLVDVLRRGVAYHHAALPDDVQVEIEDALRAGRLRYVVATTTLTEGVNLPVRSVFIAARGYWTSDGFVETMDAPKLVNTMGRAGRACIETEGWVVLAVPAQFSEGLFDQLQVADDALNVRSRLATDDALTELAEFEDLMRTSTDAVFETGSRRVSDFLSYVWFIADALAELQATWTKEDVLAALTSTLAWTQLDVELRARWLAVAEHGFAAYEQTDPGCRRRWSRSGLPLPGARSLEQLAETVHQILLDDALLDPMDVDDVLEAVFGDGRLDDFLAIGTVGFRGFRERTSSPRTSTLDVDLYQLLHDWVHGVDLFELGVRHLSAVTSDDFRYAQLSEFITSVLEHHLPWLCGNLLSWVNDARSAQQLPAVRPDLPALIHFGVDSAEAAELLSSGVRSRRLALAVASQYRADTPDVGLREWVASLGVDAWRTRFAPAPSEIADLLVFSRVPDANLASSALEEEAVTISVWIDGSTIEEEQPAFLRHDYTDEPPSIGVFDAAGVRLGRVSAEHHDEADLILKVGLPLSCVLSRSASGGGELRLQLSVPT